MSAVRQFPAYDQGVSAFHAEQHYDENPYGVFSSSFGLWSKGWNFAREAKEAGYTVQPVSVEIEKPAQTENQPPTDP